MSPHCDAMDGPVVTAAAAAFEAGDVDLVLPYVPEEEEFELVEAFERALAAREETDGDARTLVERWFLETAVRLHLAGEGAGFTGLEPAGLDVGPVIPLAEAAVEDGQPEALAGFLAGTVAEAVEDRLHRVRRADQARDGSVAAERAFVSAALAFEIWAQGLYEAARTGATHCHWAAVVGAREH